MCGLTGIIALRPGRTVDAATIIRMTDAIRHRGPDGDGIFISGDASFGLGHRRLSIVDLDARANQPMQDVGANAVIVFNGEIYNHAELRRELLLSGQAFGTDHSDTEVLLAGYLQWGIDGLLARISGMYAFALCDLRDGRSFLVRDRLGIKPLYFMEHEGGLAFASEIKALLEQTGVIRRLCPVAAWHYMTFATAPAPLTLFEGIAKLPAGHYLTVSRDGHVAPHRYWAPGTFLGTAPASLTRDDAVQMVRAQIETSVRQMMVADVPVGLFLSGGVDSGTSLALMSAMMDQPVRSFTVGFRDGPAELDEVSAARQQAKRHGALHSEILIDEREAQSCLADLVRYQDEPLADWVCLPLFFLARLARQSGIKTVLIGEGADELFCGYNAYMRSLKMMHAFRFAPRWPGPLRDLAHQALSILLPPGRTGLRRKGEEVLRGLTGDHLFWTGAVFVTDINKSTLACPQPGTERPWDAYGLLDARLAAFHSRNVIEVMADDLARQGPNPDDLARVRHAELSLRLPELLLMRADKMTMAHSLEGRVPFLDHRLVETALSLSQTLLIGDGRPKQLMKDAVADLLPPERLNAGKKGFGAPVAGWLRTGFGEQVERDVFASSALDEIGIRRDVLKHWFALHRSGRDLSLLLWPVINLALWHRYWIEDKGA